MQLGGARSVQSPPVCGAYAKGTLKVTGGPRGQRAGPARPLCHTKEEYDW